MPRTNMNYHAKAIGHDRWHVIGPGGYPVYDGAPFGKDKPLLFTSEESACDYATRCNEDSDGTEVL